MSQFWPGVVNSHWMGETPIKMWDQLKDWGNAWLKSAVAVVSIIAVTAQAEDQHEDSDQLAEMNFEELADMEVFTAANLLPTQTSKAPGTVYSFTARDFRRFGVRRIDDLLQFIPGLQINQHRKRHQSVWARGIVQRYNDKFVLLVDGVRQQQLYYGHFSLGDQFPLEQVEKVEVILGPASSLYGANAFSGLISITTKQLSDKPELTTTLELGNYDRQKVSAMYNSSRLQGFASYLDQEAPFDEDRSSFIGGETLQPLDEDYQSLYLKARLAPGLTGKIDYMRNETPFLFIPNTQDAYVDSEYWSAALNYEVGDLDRGRLEANVYYQQENIREYEKVHPTGALGYEERQDATMAGISLTGLKRWGEHTAALGVSWRYEEAEDTEYTRWFRFNRGLFSMPETGDLLSEPGMTSEDYAVFLQDVWSLSDTLSLTVGLRYDDFEQFDNYLNYRIAMNYSPTPLHNWKLMYGTAIRTPTLREYLKVLEGTSFVPSVPDAERIKTLELGYYLNSGRYRASATLYHNTLEDFIHEMPTPNGADEYFSNIEGQYTAYGAEGVLDIWLTDRLSTRFTAAYVDYDVKPLLYAATWTGSMTATYQFAQRHEIGLSLVYNNEREDRNQFDRDDADAYVLTNLYLSGDLGSTLRYRLGIDNLFDTQIYDTAADFGNQYNTEKARRQLWLELTWTPVF
ncbi:TonB-dependent receptor plug domain-containing protein [Pseudomaricurvus sp.]|uniref:TonB-dependent receptor plug domain-containing protein n=1 Tax=Pseudomaricurvus sp. TaxID=2004510 RepID=UPI003F6D61EE